jgi:hypothetical protein
MIMNNYESCGSGLSKYLLLFSLVLQPSAVYGLLVSRGFLITHNDAPQSVGLLLDEWSARLETST